MATQASTASKTAAPAAAPANITVNIQTPTPQKLLIARCAKDRSRLVGVRRPNGIYYLYNYDSDLDKMIPHVCSCQVKTYEVDLQPLYSAHSEKLGCTVIFMFNKVTYKTEQYVYRFETDHFEQVEDTGLVYNPTQFSNFHLVAMLKGPQDEQVMIERDHTSSLRKLILRGGAFKAMAASRIETLMMKLIQDETEDDYESSEYDSDETDSEDDVEEDAVFDNYIESIESVVLSSCTHHSVVNAFNYNTYDYRVFSYNDFTYDFQILECGCDFEIKVRERHLKPCYTDFSSQDNKYVMHVYNTITGVMEKYCLVGNGLKQVDYPELVYDPTKVSTSPVILVSTHPTSTFVFLRDANGRLSREVFCPVQVKYVSTGSELVKTYTVQKKEAEKKKREERKLKKKADREEQALKKAAQEKERQDQEALVQALTTETLQTAERIAKRSTAAEFFRRQREEKLEKEENEALDALKKTMAEAVNGPAKEDQGKQRDDVDFLESELGKLSCGQVPAAPIKPGRVPKVNLTSTICQTDISRQDFYSLPRPLFEYPTAEQSADAIKGQFRFEGPSNMYSYYNAVTGPRLDNVNKF